MPLDEMENKTANKVINSKTGNRDSNKASNRRNKVSSRRNKVSSRRSRVSKVNRANAGNRDKTDSKVSRDNKDKKEKVRVNNRAASSQVNNKVDNSRLVVRKTVGNHSAIDNE